MTTTVRDNAAQNRFEIYDDDQLAGFAAYHLNQDRIAFTHTEVDPQFEGRGLAKELVTQALVDVRQRELRSCRSVGTCEVFIARNEETYLDLVPKADRERFDLPGADR